MSRSAKFLLASIFLAIFFAAPEIFLWAHADHFQEPLRIYRGDTAHYLQVLHTGMLEGPKANAYFFEQPASPAQFWFLQSFAHLFPDISIVWANLALTVLVALSVFFLLVALGLPGWASFSFVLLYGPAAFAGAALGNWYLPALLGGMLCAEKFWEGNWRWSLLGILLFSVHPVSFALGGLAISMLWVLKLVRAWRSESRNFFIWVLFSSALFFPLFLPFVWGTLASHDTLYRIVAIDTRIPFHLLFSLQLLFLAALAYCVEEPALAAFAASAFIGLNSYVLTGRYIANDHYAIVGDFLVVLLAMCVWVRGGKRWLGWASFFLFLLSFFDTLNYLDFRLGYIGRYLPMLISYGTIAVFLLWPSVRNFIPRFSYIVCPLFLCVSLFYAGVLEYKMTQAEFPNALRAQAYRPLLTSLRSAPFGVVLADPETSTMIGLFTSQKVYWSQNAFSETATDEELKTRWLFAKQFFPDAPGMEPVFVTGTTNRCTDFHRDRYLKYIPWVQSELCAPNRAREAEWPLLLAEAAAGRHDPVYRIDYLVRGNTITSWTNSLMQ